MKKLLSLITLLLLSVATFAEDFDIVGTWYQYEEDQEGLDGIWTFNADQTGIVEDYNRGEADGIRDFTYSFDAANSILTLYMEKDKGTTKKMDMPITIVSPTEFTYAEEGDVLRWVKQTGPTTVVEINEENFPDENFRNYLRSDWFGYGKDGVLDSEEIKKIQSIGVELKNIASLKGIEFFTQLIDLSCYGNQLTTLDISKNTGLKSLSCFSNQLTALDLSNNTALEYLSCASNQLNALDLSKNTVLEDLSCSNNLLTTLDLSNNTALRYLFCDYNQLTTLDLSKNAALQLLNCARNQLTTLDLSKNTNIWQIWFCTNQIKNAGMDALINSLPINNGGELYVIENTQNDEGNVCTKTQVAAANAKGWKVFCYNAETSLWEEYEGSDQSGMQKVSIDNSSTGIVYTLSGQKVSAPRQGINIINGKKVLKMTKGD